MILGDWMILTTKGNPSNVPMSVVAISQANASKITRIDPIPLEPGQKSFIPNNQIADTENSRVYGMDGRAGKKTVGVDFDPVTGNMSVAWDPVDMMTFGWINLIGDPRHRVLVASNMNVTNSTKIVPGPENATYTEQVQWRDADTVIAASDFFSPMSEGAQIWPGYGGLNYHMLFDGHIMALKVLPQTNATGASTSTSTSSQNSTVGATTPAGGR
jgi:hypothetical protein